MLHIVDRILNELALVDYQHQLDVVALAVDPLHNRPRFPGHCHSVGPGLLAHPQAHHRLAVDLHQAVDILVAVDHLRHVAQADRHAIDHGDDGVGDLLDRTVFPAGAHVHIADALAHISAGEGDVLAQQGLAHVIGGELAGGQAVAFQLHLDLAVDPAPHVHRSRAGDLLEALGDLPFQDAGQLFHVAPRFGAEDHHREVIRIEFPDARRFHLRRKVVADAVDGGAHVVGGLVDIGALGKFHRNPALSFLGAGAHRLHIGHPGEGVFHPVGDQGLDLLRSDIGIIGAHS